MIMFLSSVSCSPSDKEFIIQLYEEYHRLMFFVVKQYIPDFSIHEDIVQECLVNLIKKVETLKPMERCALSGYVVSTVRNTSINYLKHQGRILKHQTLIEDDKEDEVLAVGASMDELITLMEHKSKLKAIWPMLRQEEQILLEGKYILGYSDRELALQLKCKPDSIRMKLTRARRKALKLLVEQEGESHDEA